MSGPKYRRLPRAKCDGCGKVVAVLIASGGNDYVYRRHVDRTGERCASSGMYSPPPLWVDDGHDGRPRRSGA